MKTNHVTDIYIYSDSILIWRQNHVRQYLRTETRRNQIVNWVIANPGRVRERRHGNTVSAYHLI